MRSSHAAALGHSGIWNWTCSVFSAITAASSLAAGSVHISPGKFCNPVFILETSNIQSSFTLSMVFLVSYTILLRE